MSALPPKADIDRRDAPNCGDHLGIAIVGGLLVSQALTLYTTPVIYLYLERAAQWISRQPRTGMPAVSRLAQK
jgi:hypothetical protein